MPSTVADIFANAIVTTDQKRPSPSGQRAYTMTAQLNLRLPMGDGEACRQAREIAAGMERYIREFIQEESARLIRDRDGE